MRPALPLLTLSLSQNFSAPKVRNASRFTLSLLSRGSPLYLLSLFSQILSPSDAKRDALRTYLPFQASVLGDDSAKSVDIAFGQLLLKSMQILPRIPLRANQLAGNSVAGLRG